MRSPAAGCGHWRTPDGLLTAIAIDGKRLRGVPDGQVKLLAAMLHEEKAIIAQHRIPDDTTEATQAKELLEPVDPDYFLFVEGNQPSLQKAVFDAIQQDGPRDPNHTELDYSHGRIIRRSLRVTTAAGIDFPHVTRAARIRRDGHDLDGTLISKETAHAVTSLDEDRASSAGLARIAPGQWGIGSVHWLRGTAYAEDTNTGYAGNGPQVMATLRNLAISLLYLAGVTEITRTIQATGRNRNRILHYLPL